LVRKVGFEPTNP